MFPPFPHGGLCPWTSLEFSHDLGYSTPKLAIPNSFSVSAYVINNSDCMWKNNCLHPTTEEVNAIARDVCLSVCLLARLLRNACMHGFGWHFCLSTGVGTWTNWSTFEPDPDHSPDAGTALLSPILYALHPECYYVRKIPRTCIGHGYSLPIAAATCGFDASKHRCRK